MLWFAWQKIPFGDSSRLFQIPGHSKCSHLCCIYHPILFRWPSAAGQHQKVSTMTIKPEGKIRRAAAKTASSRAPLQHSHCLFAHGFYTNMRGTFLFLLFLMQALLSLFSLSIWLERSFIVKCHRLSCSSGLFSPFWIQFGLCSSSRIPL